MELNYKNSEEYFNRAYGNNFYENKYRPILVGINIQSPENIGGLIRLAGNLGCAKIIFTSTNQRQNHTKIKRVASNAINKITVLYTEMENWQAQIPPDYDIVAIETAHGATNLFDTKLNNKIAFVVGNESNGISNMDLKKCKSAIYIPMMGHTLSMNVIQSAAVAGFEWIRQQMKAQED